MFLRKYLKLLNSFLHNLQSRDFFNIVLPLDIFKYDTCTYDGYKHTNSYTSSSLLPDSSFTYFSLFPDVIGVCKSAADLQELTAKSTGKLLKKRELTLVDNSGGAVSKLKYLYCIH